MKLRWRFVLYVVAVNAAAGAVAAPFLASNPIWLLALEGALALSLLLGLRLVRGLFRTLALIQDGAQFLEDGDFTSRLRQTRQPELDRLVGVYNRMVDHLRDERARLQEQHHFLAQILEQSPSAIVVLDFDGAISLCNPAARRLLDGDALAGAPAVPPATQARDAEESAGAPAVRPATQARGAEESAGRGPVREGTSPPTAMASPNGRRFSDFPPEATLPRALAALGPGETRVVSLPDGRRLKCRRGAFLDRGFQRGFFLVEELTDELRQAEKAAYEKLIRMMSHEVNNSVGASGSLLHSCLTFAPLLPEEQARDLESALRVVIARTEQLGGLMRSFADVVRLPPPQRRPTDVEALLRGVAILLRAECERRRVTWAWAIEEPPGPIDLDPVQLEQVFVNVAKNALEAIGEAGTLTVRLGRRGARPFAAIEDTGPGIPPEARPHLFTPFFTTKETGQGIGLMLIQQILDQHHFDYALETPPTGPTRFTILFR